MNENYTDVEKKLLGALKTHAPAKLRAYQGDDDGRDVAIAGPSNRKRWSRVIATVAKLAWSRIELLDKSGALLDTVDNDSPAVDLEDLPSGKSGTMYAEVNRYLQLMLSAQEKVLSYRDKETKTILDRQADTIKEMSSAMHSIAEAYREQVEVVRESASEEASAAAAVADAQSEGGMGKLIEQLLPLLLPALVQKLTAASAAPPVSNGHNH